MPRCKNRQNKTSRLQHQTISKNTVHPRQKTGADNGCPCGWEWPYNLGEPKGRRHPSPLIQLTANSEEQVRNTYRPLVATILLGPLKELMRVRDTFIRILQPGREGEADALDLDRIDVVTCR